MKYLAILMYIGKELEKQLPLGDTSAELSFVVRQLQAEKDREGATSLFQHLHISSLAEHEA